MLFLLKHDRFLESSISLVNIFLDCSIWPDSRFWPKSWLLQNTAFLE